MKVTVEDILRMKMSELSKDNVDVEECVQHTLIMLRQAGFVSSPTAPPPPPSEYGRPL